MSWLRRLIGGLVLASLLSLVVLPQGEASAGVACSGHFVNPITDVCWDCLFPLTIGDIPIFAGDHADGPNPSSPICVCEEPPPLFVKIGLSIGFWEPVRLADVTEHAWCFPNLGGITLPVGFGYASKAGTGEDEQTNKFNAYHVHWYIYPVMYWLELLTDFLCLENASFDIGYVSELDPTWNDDYTAALISPEVLLFNNPIATAACALDCIQASTTGMGNPALYWCAGCQGTMFPMTGNVSAESGQASGSVLAAERFAFKMHRELLAEGTSGPAAVCQKYPMPIMDKRQYRFQIVNPTALVASDRLACPAVGVTSIPWEPGKVVPVVGQDLGFLVWRKRNCCAGL